MLICIDTTAKIRLNLNKPANNDFFNNMLKNKSLINDFHLFVNYTMIVSFD
jgi:hypothetical protein